MVILPGILKTIVTVTENYQKRKEYKSMQTIYDVEDEAKRKKLLENIEEKLSSITRDRYEPAKILCHVERLQYKIKRYQKSKNEKKVVTKKDLGRFRHFILFDKYNYGFYGRDNSISLLKTIQKFCCGCSDLDGLYIILMHIHKQIGTQFYSMYKRKHMNMRLKLVPTEEIVSVENEIGRASCRERVCVGV